MRICLLCYRGNPYCGGQGVYIHYLSQALAARGHDVSILVGPPYPGPMPWARVRRIHNSHYWGKRREFLPQEVPLDIFRPLEFFEFASTRLGYFSEPLAFSLRAWRAFKKLHKEQPFDVIHDVETLGYGLLLMRCEGLPTVATIHHPLSLDRESHLIKASSWLERYYNVVFFPLIMQSLVARHMDAIITSSRAGMKEIIRTFRVRPFRTHIVYSGVDLETFSPDPEVRRDDRRILFVGNAEDPRKGMKVLLEAMKLLPPSTHLVIVDEAEPKKSYAPSLVRSLGLQNRVTFTGRVTVEELVEHYRQARVVVLPSKFEGFGLPVVEALACETPVVVTDAGSLPEVVGQDGGGLVVPPDDPVSLAQAIHRIIANPLLAQEMGKKGRRRVEALFSWSQTARRTEEVYIWAKKRRERLRAVQ